MGAKTAVRDQKSEVRGRKQRAEVSGAENIVILIVIENEIETGTGRDYD